MIRATTHTLAGVGATGSRCPKAPETALLLAAHKMVYLGTVNADRDLRFGAEDLQGATHLLVLSLGDL